MVIGVLDNRQVKSYAEENLVLGRTALSAPAALTRWLRLSARPWVSVELGWGVGHCGAASRASSKLVGCCIPCPPCPRALGLRESWQPAPAAGVLPPFCKVKAPLQSGPLRPRKLLLRGSQVAKGRFVSQGWWVREHSVPWKEHISCT